MQLVISPRVSEGVDHTTLSKMMMIARPVLPAADSIDQMDNFILIFRHRLLLTFEFKYHTLDDPKELCLNALLNVATAAFEPSEVMCRTALIHQEATHEPL